MMRARFLALALGLAMFMLTGLSPQPLGAQEEAEIGLEQQEPVLDSTGKVKPRDPTKGAVTNMPIPRYVSLKGGIGNARRGPGLTHRIDWVFTTAGMPLRVTAEHEHWRRVEEAEGMGGWVHYALLSGVRTVLVTQDMAEFHDRADLAAPVAFQAEMGVIGRLMECNPDWCRVNIQGEKGWALKTALWGVDPGEIIE
jgi:SH3-like domain-containing protein